MYAPLPKKYKNNRFFLSPRRKCGGKNCYDKRGAQTMVNHAHRHGKILRTYPCPFGDHWHITKKSYWEE